MICRVQNYFVPKEGQDLNYYVGNTDNIDSLITVWRLPDDSLTTDWWPPDDFKITPWWLPTGYLSDNCLMTYWHFFVIFPDDYLTLIKNLKIKSLIIYLKYIPYFLVTGMVHMSEPMVMKMKLLFIWLLAMVTMMQYAFW